MTRLAWNGSSWITDRPGGVIYGFPSMSWMPGIAGGGPIRRFYAIGTDASLYEAVLSGSAWSWTNVSAKTGVSGLVMAGSPSAMVGGYGGAYVRTSNNLLGLVWNSDGVTWRFSTYVVGTAGTPTIDGTPTAVDGNYCWAAGTYRELRQFTTDVNGFPVSQSMGGVIE